MDLTLCGMGILAGHCRGPNPCLVRGLWNVMLMIIYKAPNLIISPKRKAYKRGRGSGGGGEGN